MSGQWVVSLTCPMPSHQWTTHRTSWYSKRKA